VRTATTFRAGHRTSDCGYGDDIVAALRREELREFGARLSDHRELKGCGRKIRKGRVGSATEILEVTTSCRLKWLCPTCGHNASRREAARLKRRLRAWTTNGGAVALLTLTQSHCLDDGLADLWSRLEAGWASLVRGSGWAADKRSCGVCGYVRIAEVVHNAAAGWNVHYHVILLLDGELGQPDLEGLRASLATRFTRGVADRGGHALVDRQDVRPVRPGTEARLAGYCFKGTTMRWSADGARTPMAILSDLESTGEGFTLWEEYSAAVSADRRTQVITSKHIDIVCTPAAPLPC
jgi:Replication protein